MKTQQEAAEKAIRKFEWEDYGLDAVVEADAEWVPVLARKVLEAVAKVSQRQPIDMQAMIPRSVVGSDPLLHADRVLRSRRKRPGGVGHHRGHPHPPGARRSRRPEFVA